MKESFNGLTIHPLLSSPWICLTCFGLDRSKLALYFDAMISRNTNAMKSTKLK
jgi:hypothetical protein